MIDRCTLVCNNIRVARKYELKKRAERQDGTRQRIVEAAVRLHTTVGPARTSISAIAEEAGVERHTVYRHFPDDRSLFLACSGQYAADHPLPDPAGWTAIADPEGGSGTASPSSMRTTRRTATSWRPSCATSPSTR